MFVGKLQMAVMAEGGSDLTRDETRILQDRRVVRLAINLAAILDGYAAVRLLLQLMIKRMKMIRKKSRAKRPLLKNLKLK